MIDDFKDNDVAVLMRQSTNKKSQDNSIPKQLQLNAEFAKEINWPFPTMPERFYSATVSGMSPNRPELDRLLKDIRSGDVKRVMVYDWSRASRSILGACGLWNTIRKAGALLAIQSQKRVIDSKKLNEGDFLFISVNGVINEAQWLTHARLVRDGMRRRAGNGKWPAPVPFGFIRNEDGILIPNPDEMRIVERQFEAAAVYGIREACKVLQEENIFVSPSTLHYRLHNSVYIGILSYGKTKNDFKLNPNAKWGEMPGRKRMRSDELIVVEDAFISPVSKEAIEKFQVNAQSRRWNKSGLGQRKGKTPFLLAGLAYCGLCGKRMSRKAVKGVSKGGLEKAYDYVGCGTEKCPNKCLKKEIIEDQIRKFSLWEHLPKFELREAIKTALDIKIQFALKKQAEYENEIIKLTNAKDKFGSMYSEEIAKDKDYAQAYQKLCFDLHETQVNLYRMERTVNEISGATPRIQADILGWCINFRERWYSMIPRQKMLFLRRTFCKVRVFENYLLSFEPWSMGRFDFEKSNS